MRKGGRRTMLGLCGVVLVVLACGWLLYPRGKPPWREVAPDVAPPPVVATPATAVVVQPPLPAPELPFASVYAELRRRADAGDPHATCRLAMELDACAEVSSSMASYARFTRTFESDMAKTGLADAQRVEQRRRLREQGDALLRRADACEGVPASTLQQRVQLWRQAALAGQPYALGHYAAGSVFPMLDTLRLLPELERYRGEAEALATLAAQRGDGGTVLQLAGAYAPRDGSATRITGYYLSQVVDADPVRALALFRRSRSAGGFPAPLLRSIDETIAGLERDASAEQLAHADALGREWDARWQPIRWSAPAKNTLQQAAVGDIGAARCAE